MYRRPLPTTNLSFVSAVMWDGRASTPGHAIKDDLITQAADATVQHALGPAPSPAQLRGIVEFELGLVTAQVRDRAAGSLTADGARGGPAPLTREAVLHRHQRSAGHASVDAGRLPGAVSGLDPPVFTLFGRWQGAASPERQAIARGEALFNTRQFVIDDVPGLNGDPQDPVSGPMPRGPARCVTTRRTPATTRCRWR